MRSWTTGPAKSPATSRNEVVWVPSMNFLRRYVVENYVTGQHGAAPDRRPFTLLDECQKIRLARHVTACVMHTVNRLYSSKRPSSAASARFGAFAGMKLITNLNLKEGIL